MIFIDTSVWIQYFRVNDPKLNETLYHLLDTNQAALSSLVWLELLSGATQKELPRLKRVLSALPRFQPLESTWSRIEQWIIDGTKKGQRFGVTDLLIASTAREHHSKLWSLDTDFKRMEKLNFINLFG
jgi:predicted nucleic acid-binding protein